MDTAGMLRMLLWEGREWAAQWRMNHLAAWQKSTTYGPSGCGEKGQEGDAKASDCVNATIYSSPGNMPTVSHQQAMLMAAENC